MRPHLLLLNLLIGGSQAPKKVLDDLVECCVENSLDLPDMCTIRIEDNQFVWLDSDLFQEGKAIETQCGEEVQALQTVFKGEIVSVELDLSAIGTPTLTVRCLSKLHRLHRGRFQRSFVQVTDTDIVNKVATEVGLDVDADSTPTVRDWVFQNNQTNWEFVSLLAKRNGYRLYLDGEKTLKFKKVTDSGSGVLKLTWGKDLRSFRPRTTSSPQVDQVVVQGWDTQKKAAISETAQTPVGIPQTGVPAEGGSIAKKAFGAAKMVIVDRPILTSEEAQALATSVCDEIGGQFLEADGLCFAQPTLAPGMQVQIDNIGQRFSGKYFVTATTHTYTPSEGLVTQFTVSGKKPSSLLSLLDKNHIASRTQLGGNVVVGVVTNNQDPDDLGRVKVKYPWLTEEHESFWVRIVCPMAGPGRGFEFIPEVDDEVLVAFEHGDIHRPYILGALWNGVDKPVEPNSQVVQGAKVQRRVIKTRIGHFVLFDDTDGKGEMSMTTANNHRLALDDANQNITLKSTSGHTVVLDDANKNITVKTKEGHTVVMDDQGRKILIQDMTGSNTITIDSNSNNIEMVCMGDFSVQATGTVSIQADMNVQIQGNAGIDISSPAEVGITGAMVNINS